MTSLKKINSIKVLATTLLSTMLVAAIAIACVGAFSSTALASTGTSYTINVKFGQTEARNMLTSINQWRTGSEAWAWNQDNATKTTYSSAALSYDYDLEKVAMQRAAEIAVSYSHTRPDGQNTWSAYSDMGYAYMTCGENIAAGQTSANAVYISWREDNYKYEGQGHRRNMLNPNFKAIGIGHVYFNGLHYWVQEFSDRVHNATAPAANDSSTNVNVNINPSSITKTSIAASTKSISAKVGTSFTLPTATLQLCTTDYWNYMSPTFPVVATPTYTISSSYLKRSGTKATPLKAGKTSITVKVYDKSVTVPVTISKGTNPLSVKAASKTIKVKASKLMSKAQSISGAIKFSNKGKGKITYTKSSGKKNFTVNKKTGKITVKKGTRKGSYTVKIKVKAAGNASYKSATKTVAVKIKVN